MDRKAARAFIVQLIINHHEAIVRFFLGKEMPPSAAADKAGEVFANAYVALLASGPPLAHKEASWLHRVAANVAHGIPNEQRLPAQKDRLSRR